MYKLKTYMKLSKIKISQNKQMNELFKTPSRSPMPRGHCHRSNLSRLFIYRGRDNAGGLRPTGRYIDNIIKKLRRSEYCFIYGYRHKSLREPGLWHSVYSVQLSANLICCTQYISASKRRGTSVPSAIQCLKTARHFGAECRATTRRLME